eukprot:CFRG1405T1
MLDSMPFDYTQHQLLSYLELNPNTSDTSEDSISSTISCPLSWESDANPAGDMQMDTELSPSSSNSSSSTSSRDSLEVKNRVGRTSSDSSGISVYNVKQRTSAFITLGGETETDTGSPMFDCFAFDDDIDVDTHRFADASDLHSNFAMPPQMHPLLHPWLSLESDFTELLHSSFDECGFDIPTPPSRQENHPLSNSDQSDFLVMDSVPTVPKMDHVERDSTYVFSMESILPTPAPSTPASPLLAASTTQASLGLAYEEGIAPFKLFDLTETGPFNAGFKSSSYSNHLLHEDSLHPGIDVLEGSMAESVSPMVCKAEISSLHNVSLAHSASKRTLGDSGVDDFYTPPPSGTSSPQPAKRVKSEVKDTILGGICSLSGGISGTVGCLNNKTSLASLVGKSSAGVNSRKTTGISPIKGRNVIANQNTTTIAPSALCGIAKTPATKAGSGSTTTTSTSMTEEVGGVVIHKVRVTSTSSTGEIDISDIPVPPNLNEAEAKRHVHNVLERKRREDLRQSFDTLREAVPDLVANDKSPKVLILNGAANYIRTLTSKNKELCDTREKLTTERQTMISRLEALCAMQVSMNLNVGTMNGPVGSITTSTVPAVPLPQQQYIHNIAQNAITTN